jgi:hypothetical protein
MDTVLPEQGSSVGLGDGVIFVVPTLIRNHLVTGLQFPLTEDGYEIKVGTLGDWHIRKRPLLCPFAPIPETQEAHLKQIKVLKGSCKEATQL